ncbi:MAG TPA: outer membrane beta-barrel protein [Acidobacteriaceae bacterium]
MNRFLVLLVAAGLLAAAPLSHGQALPTATRLADLQIGGGYTLANSDYVPNRIRGFMFYGDFDLRGHYGLEADFHQVTDPNPDPLVPSNHFSERTYEVGGRYLRHYHHQRLAPYAKLLYGRGVVNFRAQQIYVPAGLLTYIDNVAYNMAVLGGGLDYRLTPHINLRADFEYQHYFASDRDLPSGLSPTLFSFGVAYRFPVRGPGRR